jgi:sigma-E factor negative regulatory protein RseC
MMPGQSSQRIINHEGVVSRNDTNCVVVRIIASSACSACHAEGTCSLSGKEEKIIEVKGNYDVNPGDSVVVEMKQSMGYTALLLGYLVPLAAVIISLLVLVSFKVSELLSGVCSVAILIPYYTVLYLFRKSLNDKFTFTLKY